jgi:murein L,D-transpeptidase YafK
VSIRTLVPILILSFFVHSVCLAEGKGLYKGGKASLIVNTGPHTLRLYEDNKVVKEFRIAIGRGGVDKHKKGDNKTPRGEYFLGTPRPSHKFGIFIPIGYPTDRQRAQGFTGSDVGIHGPYRLFKWLGRITTWFDWTQGCIAVANDDDIAEIARWVTQTQVSRIIIK